MTVKWGAPAIWAGKHPEDGRFFIAKKSLFNKTPLFYTSEQEIKDASELSGDLETKFLESFKYLSKLSWGDKILQGDLMFTDTDKKTETINNLEYVTFQPNTIKYVAVTGSPLAGAIMTAKLGIVFHTLTLELPLKICLPALVQISHPWAPTKMFGWMMHHIKMFKVMHQC